MAEPKDLHVQIAVASARLEGLEIDDVDLAVIEAAAAGELTTDEARRRLIEQHGITLPTGHRLAQPIHTTSG